jgi:predicted nucleic acid-binding protein
MNVVDSSGWLEYFADGPNAAYFAKPIEATRTLVVPTPSIFEVFKRVMTQRGEDAALEAAALMRQGRVVPLDDALALEAARLSVTERLPMADSVILATARAHKATLWTQDADFANVTGGRFLPKTGSTADRSEAPPARGRTK